VSLDGHVRLDQQTPTARDYLVLFGDCDDLKKPMFISLFLWLDRASHGEHLERATEIEDFNLVKEKNTYGEQRFLHGTPLPF
jgi:hypothetical protein